VKDETPRLVKGCRDQGAYAGLAEGIHPLGVAIDVVQDVGDVFLEARPNLGTVVGEARATGERGPAPRVGRRALEGIPVRFDVGVGAAVDVQVLSNWIDLTAYALEPGAGAHLTLGKWFLEPGVHYLEVHDTLRSFSAYSVQSDIVYRVSLGLDLGPVSPFAGAALLQRLEHGSDVHDTHALSVDGFLGAAFL